jgi:hypothetical protein
MAASGYTPISLYYSATASAVPTAGNLVAGELALNTADGKLFYKDSSNVVQVIATKAGASGTVTSVSGTGTVNGITLTGTVTSSGSLTLGGTLSGVSLTTQVTGTLPIANGGTNATTESGARTNLGATTVGSNFFTLANPSAIRFPRINADNTVSVLTDSDFRTAIGAGTGNGTVTSVGGTGTVNGITLTGTVTSSGSLTLGGTLSGVSLSTQVTGTLPVGNGGTGATSLTGVVIGSGASAFTTKTNPSGDFVGTTDSQTLTNKTTTNLVFDGSYTEEVFTITDGASVDINPANGTIQLWTLGASRTPTATNFAAGQSITLMIDDGTAYSVTWSTIGVTWVTDGGSAPTLNTSGYTTIVLWKVSTTVYGARVGDA